MKIEPKAWALFNTTQMIVDVASGLYRHEDVAIVAAQRKTNRFRAFVAIPMFTSDIAADAAAYAMIETLRSGDEGDSVTLCASNPDFVGPNDVVICNGARTAWEDRRFEGDSVLDCLTKAIAEHPSSVKS